jgi:hypothetical protein
MALRPKDRTDRGSRVALCHRLGPKTPSVMHNRHRTPRCRRSRPAHRPCTRPRTTFPRLITATRHLCHSAGCRTDVHRARRCIGRSNTMNRTQQYLTAGPYARPGPPDMLLATAGDSVCSSLLGYSLELSFFSVLDFQLRLSRPRAAAPLSRAPRPLRHCPLSVFVVVCCPPPATRRPPPTRHPPPAPPATHYPLPATRYSLLAIHYPLPTTRHSLPATRRSLLANRNPQPATRNPPVS